MPFYKNKVEPKWMFRGNNYYPLAKVIFFITVMYSITYVLRLIWDYFGLPPILNDQSGILLENEAYDLWPPETRGR
jgi:hypothetical protein